MIFATARGSLPREGGEGLIGIPRRPIEAAAPLGPRGGVGRVPPLARALWAGGVAALLLGGLDEWNQRFTPGRASDPVDLLADILGGIAGAAAFALLTARFRRRS